MRNVFLSEFDPEKKGTEPVVALLERRLELFGDGEISPTSDVYWWAGLLAMTFMLMDGIVLWLGWYAGADAMSIEIAANVKIGGSTSRVFGYECMGYLLEANHGFTYMVLVPLFVMMTAYFLHCADKGLRRIGADGMIRRGTVDSPPDGTMKALVSVARWNRRAFLPFGIPALLLFVIIGSVVQYEAEAIPLVTDDEMHRGLNRDLGYGQSPWATTWATNVNTEKTPRARYVRMFDMYAMRDIEVQVLAKLADEDSKPLQPGAKRKRDWDIAGARVTSFDGEQKVVGLAAASAGLLDPMVRVVGSGDLMPTSMHWHWAFEILLLTMEGSFHGFCAWVVMKLIFYLLVLGRLLPAKWDEPYGPENSHLPYTPAKRKRPFELIQTGNLLLTVSWKQPLRAKASWSFSVLEWRLKTRGKARIWIRPTIEDDSGRYGLGPLMDTHFAAMYLVAIGCFMLALQTANQLGPGVDNDWKTGHTTVGASIVILLLVSLSVSALLIGPFRFFEGRLRNFRRGSEQELQGRLGALSSRDKDNEKRGKLVGRLAIIRRQSTASQMDKAFTGAAVAVFMLVLLPFGLKLDFMQGLAAFDSVNAVNKTRAITAELCELASGLHCHSQRPVVPSVCDPRTEKCPGPHE